MSKNKKDVKHQIEFCEKDLYNSIVLKTAKQCGLITRDVDATFEYTEDEKCNVLEKLLGFKNGWYESEHIPFQKSRFSNVVVENSNRLFGYERTDNDWLSTGLASSEIKEIMKWGEVL